MINLYKSLKYLRKIYFSIKILNEKEKYFYR